MVEQAGAGTCRRVERTINQCKSTRRVDVNVMRLHYCFLVCQCDSVVCVWFLTVCVVQVSMMSYVLVVKASDLMASQPCLKVLPNHLLIQFSQSVI